MGTTKIVQPAETLGDREHGFRDPRGLHQPEGWGARFSPSPVQPPNTVLSDGSKRVLQIRKPNRIDYLYVLVFPD